MLISIFGWQLNNDLYTKLCNNISFAFLGFLIFSNVRSFSLNIVNFLNTIMGYGFIKTILTTEIVIYFIAEIFGLYFIGTLILLQASVPQIYLENLRNLIGEVNVLNQFKIFDLIFLISSISSLIIIITNHYFKSYKFQQYKEDKIE